MSRFGPILGSLPLLRLPAAKLSKLSGQRLCDAQAQLRHHCLRRAWFASVQSNLGVRQALDVIVGQASLVWADIHGHEPSEFFLDLDMEHARRENEWWTCFGFFLQAEIDHILREERAGPVLRGALPPEHHELGTYVYCPVLADMLTRCREHVRGDDLALETVRIVQQITGAPHWLNETPPQIAAFFELGELVLEAAGGK